MQFGLGLGGFGRNVFSEKDLPLGYHSAENQSGYFPGIQFSGAGRDLQRMTVDVEAAVDRKYYEL